MRTIIKLGSKVLIYKRLGKLAPEEGTHASLLILMQKIFIDCTKLRCTIKLSYQKSFKL